MCPHLHPPTASLSCRPEYCLPSATRRSCCRRTQLACRLHHCSFQAADMGADPACKEPQRFCLPLNLFTAPTDKTVVYLNWRGRTSAVCCDSLFQRGLACLGDMSCKLWRCWPADHDCGLFDRVQSKGSWLRVEFHINHPVWAGDILLSHH